MLHLLVEPQFERINSINPPSLHSLKAPVVWNEDIYSLGRDRSGEGKLFRYSLSNNKWSDFSINSSIYASGSVLTTYRSKLLLISGEDMTIWELSSNDFAFKHESCVKPIPSTFPRLEYREVFITSEDEYLTIASWDRSHRLKFVQLICYDGRDWRFRKYYDTFRGSIKMGLSNEYLTNGNAMFAITTEYDVVTGVRKAPINSFDEDDIEHNLDEDDTEFKFLNWERLDVISHPKFETSRRRKYFMILHNQQLFFIDPHGVIFTSFIQPLILPLLWGNSGVNFQHPPHLVGLPDGTMLMIGMIGKHESQLDAELDVIKVSQKGKITSCKST